ncbi:MAG TPA: polymer-forming cytoskeletal protein, partial [Ktedonobacterales bacterium]|nr:polymer-forming cytoskeletal protein [Ktedonobacterales bacterium]
GGLAWLTLLPASVTLAAPAIAPTDNADNHPAPMVLACTAGHLEAYAHPLVVGVTQWLCGDADAYGGAITVLGRVSGNVTAFGGGVRISGQVDGNVLAVGGDVVLEPGARVAGDVAAWGGTTHREADVLVDGTIDRGDRAVGALRAKWFGPSGAWSFPWPALLAWSLLAALTITLFPERTARVRVVARRAAVRSLAVGLLTTVLGVILIAVLFASCIGIPISLLVTMALLAGWVLGTVAVSLWLGDTLVGLVAPRMPSRLLRALVGVALLTGLESIPGVGGAIAVLASGIGLGAALLSRFGGRRAVLPAGTAVAPAKSLSRTREPA